MMIHEVIEGFERGKLEMKCPQMELVQEECANPRVFRGGGIIRMGVENKLEFLMHAVETPDRGKLVGSIFQPEFQLGKIIPGSHYYSLRAVDSVGWEWKARGIDLDTSLGTTGVFTSGHIREIRSRKKLDRRCVKEELGLRFLTDVRLPFNQYSTTITNVAGHDRKQSKLNIGVAGIDGFEFVFEKVDGGLSLNLTSDTPFPAYVETRAVEALQFVTAKSLWAHWIRKVSGGQEEFIFTSNKRAFSNPRLMPPINFEGGGDHFGECFWPLFLRYFKYVTQHVEETLHPMSAWLNAIRHASTGSIYNDGLMLGVAVEGILGVERIGVSPARAELKAALDDLKKCISNWDGDASLAKRAVDLVSRMLEPSPKDRLHALKDAGILNESMISAWNRVRNKAAHGRAPTQEQHQGWIDDCLAVTTLIYRMIAHAIGFKGRLTNYGAGGWPLIDFPLATAVGT